MVTSRAHRPAAGKAASCSSDRDIVDYQQSPWPGGEHGGQMLTCLPCIGERHRPVRSQPHDQAIHQTGQRLPADVPAECYPVHLAPKSSQHPSIRADHPGDRGLAESPCSLNRGSNTDGSSSALQCSDDLSHLIRPFHYPRLMPLRCWYRHRQPSLVPPLRRPHQQRRERHRRRGPRHPPQPALCRPADGNGNHPAVPPVARFTTTASTAAAPAAISPASATSPSRPHRFISAPPHGTPN